MGVHDLYLSFEETTEREKGKNLGECLNIAQIARLWNPDPAEQDRLKQVMLCQFYEGVLKGFDVKKQAEERLEAHRNELRKAAKEANDSALMFHYNLELASTYGHNDYQIPFRRDPDEYFLNIKISRDDFLDWLNAIDEPRPANCLLVFWWGDNQTAAHVENAPSDESDKSKRGRGAQIEAILEAAKSLEYNPLEIPEYGKAAIKKKCLHINGVLFTPSGFDHAWKAANKLKKISMKDKEKYLSKQ